MSTIQYINGQIDHKWPELKRKYPAVQKPNIIPAQSIRGTAPMYMQRYIDEDPNSYYMFIEAQPLEGDASREMAKAFFSEVFYDILNMPSSYDINAGGNMSKEEAIHKEVLPADNDHEYMDYYEEQMAKMDAMAAEEDSKAAAAAFKEKFGFDRDDEDIIDMYDDGQGGFSNEKPQHFSDTTAVGNAASREVGMPKKIWYAVDFHVPAGGMLGYSGAGRLGNRRGAGGRRMLREKDVNESVTKAIKNAAIGAGIGAAAGWGASELAGGTDAAKKAAAVDTLTKNRADADTLNADAIKNIEGGEEALKTLDIEAPTGTDTVSVKDLKDKVGFFDHAAKYTADNGIAAGAVLGGGAGLMMTPDDDDKLDEDEQDNSSDKLIDPADAKKKGRKDDDDSDEDSEEKEKKNCQESKKSAKAKKKKVVAVTNFTDVKRLLSEGRTLYYAV